MNVTVPVYQRKRGSLLVWTTVGLGPFTRSRSAIALAKVRDALVADLRKLVEDAEPHQLPSFDFIRGTKLTRVRVELSLSGRAKRAAGLCPLVLEPRPFGPDRTATIAYHPDEQGRLFVVRDDEPLADQLARFLSRNWADHEGEQIQRLFSDEKDMLRVVAFSARPTTLLDRIRTGERDLWADLANDPARKKKKRGGMRVLSTLAVDRTAQIATGDEVHGLPRAPQRAQLLSLLGSARPRPVVVVGPRSSGKSTLVARFLADRLAADDYESHRNLDRVTHVWSISAKRIIAGMSHVGEWEERCLDLVHDLASERRILHVQDLHRFGRVGRARGSDRSLADFFRGPLARGEITMIGECTPEELALLEEEAPAFASLFVRCPLPPATPAETFRMALHVVRQLEIAHRVRFSAHALRAVMELAPALLPTEALPGQAIELLRAIARAREVDAESGGRGPELGAKDVEEIIARETGLARTLVSPDAKLDAAEVEAELGSVVLGQPEAVRVAADLVARIKAGLTDPRRPYGVLLFTGPTGTGKTELAKALAEYLYGSSNRLVRFDMSELNGPDAVARLIGDTYSPDGLLTTALTERPTCVLLLDEIDKAHRSVHNLLLQVFEDGRLTDAGGVAASFRRAVIVMTSNLGAEPKAPVGFLASPDAVLGDVARAVRDFFAPELLNRIDRVVPFRPLGEEVAVSVAEKELAKLVARRGLADRGVFVHANRAVARRVARDAFRERDGARSLKRYLDDRIGGRLAALLAAKPRAMLRVLWLFDGGDGDFVVDDEPLEERAPAGGSYALAELDGESTDDLRERLPALLPRIHALLEDERLVAATSAGDPSTRFQAEEMRTELYALERSIERALGVDDEDHEGDGHWAVHETGRGREFQRIRVRTSSLSARDRRQLFSRDELLRTLARIELLERMPARLADPDEHAVLLELARVVAPPGARFARDIDGTPTTASLLRWLTTALGATAGAIEASAVLEGDRARMGGLGPRPPEAIALRITGLGARDVLAGEDGTHVWHPHAAGPEIVRVRVLPAADPLAHLHALALEKRAFADAVRGDRGGPPPPNPSKLTPAVRRLRFDAPRRDGEIVAIELEDYGLGLAWERRVKSPVDVITDLVRLRTSRRGGSR